MKTNYIIAIIAIVAAIAITMAFSSAFKAFFTQTDKVKQMSR